MLLLRSIIVNHNPKSKIQNPQWVLFLFPVMLLFFSSCENKDIIPEDTFVKVYADFLIAQDTSFIDSKDTTYRETESFKQMIFRKHNVTSKQYEITLKYYNQNAELWEEFFEKAIAYVENQKKNFHPASQIKRKGS
jgi:hypothetical protein